MVVHLQFIFAYVFFSLSLLILRKLLILNLLQFEKKKCKTAKFETLNVIFSYRYSFVPVAKFFLLKIPNRTTKL